MAFPRMFRIKQRFEGPAVHDIPGAVRDTMRSLNLKDRVKPGQTVAITAGSRGIANIARITLAVQGCKPQNRQRHPRFYGNFLQALLSVAF